MPNLFSIFSSHPNMNLITCAWSDIETVKICVLQFNTVTAEVQISIFDERSCSLSYLLRCAPAALFAVSAALFVTGSRHCEARFVMAHRWSAATVWACRFWRISKARWCDIDWWLFVQFSLFSLFELISHNSDFINIIKMNSTTN